MPRILLPGQHSRLLIVDPASGDSEVVFDSTVTLVEAPNWSPDGRFLVVNGLGLLWRLPLGGGRVASEASLERIPTPGLPELNNDHVIAPDGGSVFVSGKDGHLYQVPWAGGEARRVTREHPAGRGYKNYLHGVSPDGETLAVVVGSRPSRRSRLDAWRTDIALVSVSSGETTLVTRDSHPDDGPDFEAGGERLWFNTERFSTQRGHAQIARVDISGGRPRQMVVSDSVDWFPHPSPDSATVIYLAYPVGTLGHPDNHEVVVRALDLDDGEPVTGAAPRDVLHLFGGQGTLNVAGWAPDSKRFACADYPLPH